MQNALKLTYGNLAVQKFAREISQDYIRTNAVWTLVACPFTEEFSIYTSLPTISDTMVSFKITVLYLII
jgi:hypothetical protein